MCKRVISICVLVCVCVCVGVCVSVYVCISVYVSVYLCTYLCVYVCLCTCVIVSNTSPLTLACVTRRYPGPLLHRAPWPPCPAWRMSPVTRCCRVAWLRLIIGLYSQYDSDRQACWMAGTLCLHTHMCIYIYVFICMYIYVCIYVCIRIVHSKQNYHTQLYIGIIIANTSLI